MKPKENEKVFRQLSRGGGRAWKSAEINKSKNEHELQKKARTENNFSCFLARQKEFLDFSLFYFVHKNTTEFIRSDGVYSKDY